MLEHQVQQRRRLVALDKPLLKPQSFKRSGGGVDQPLHVMTSIGRINANGTAYGQRLIINEVQRIDGVWLLEKEFVDQIGTPSLSGIVAMILQNIEALIQQTQRHDERFEDALQVQ